MGLETLVKQNVLKNTWKHVRDPAIFRIFVPKISFYGTPGQIH
jgi:hypothetical protein